MRRNGNASASAGFQVVMSLMPAVSRTGFSIGIVFAPATTTRLVSGARPARVSVVSSAAVSAIAVVSWSVSTGTPMIESRAFWARSGVARTSSTALVPSPSYPIHIWGPLFAGADIREVPLGTGEDFFEGLQDAYQYSWPKPRVIVMSFPHNPTTTCVDLDFFQRVVDFAREREVVLVHDNAYADLGFDGYSPPSILQAEGAKDVAVELYSLTKSYSMAGWRVAFLVGNPEIVGALKRNG